MKYKKTLSLLGLLVFCLGITASGFAQGPHYRFTEDPKTDIYFGHISYTEVENDGKDPVVYREGKNVPEVAVLNFPLAPGDTILTPADRRVEIQFDTGTLIRLDYNTEVKIETILAQSLTSNSKLTNFLLKKGQIYVMYKQYGSSEILQVLVSNAAVKFVHKSVLLIRANESGTTDIKVETGQASLLFGRSENSLEDMDLKRQDEVTITFEGQVEQVGYEGDVDFTLWNEGMNKNFLEMHRGVTGLPNPIQRMSPAVFNFAQKFSNLYGDWIWDDIYGYVWRPNTNDNRYPTGNWQPYAFGYWRQIGASLFWVPEESWGWVPYHLGLWVWNKKLGWLWIPGSAFAPAWADWNFYMGHFAWRPMSPWDFIFTNYWADYYIPWNYGLSDNTPFKNTDETFNSSSSSRPAPNPFINKINKYQLKNNSTAPTVPSKAIRNVLSNLVKALKKGDTDVLSSMKDAPNSTVVVRGENISSKSIQKMILELDQMSNVIQNGINRVNPAVNPVGYARIAFGHNDFLATLAQTMPFPGQDLTEVVPKRSTDQDLVWKFGLSGSVEESAPNLGADRESGFDRLPGRPSDLKQPFTRIRDWNPDIPAARRAGATVTYSSLDNRVRIPELERAIEAGRRLSIPINLSRSGSQSVNSTTPSSSSSGSSGVSSSGSSGPASSRSSGSVSARSGGNTGKAASGTIKKF